MALGMLRIFKWTPFQPPWEIGAKIGLKCYFWVIAGPNLGVSWDEAFLSSPWVQMLI